MSDAFDVETLRSVGELLQHAQQHGIGVTFVPGPDGWQIGYLDGRHGGSFLQADELGEGAQAAISDLDELAEERRRTRGQGNIHFRS